MRHLVLALFAAMAVLLSPIAPSSLPIFGAQQVQAGPVKKAIVTYAVAKAIQFGGRAVVNKVKDLARDPKVRQFVIDEIVDFALNNPEFTQKADELLAAIGDNMSIADRLSFPSVDVASLPDALPDLLPSPESVVDAAPSNAVFENQVPYNSRRMQGLLESVFGAGNVESKTLPPANGPNVRLANQSKWITPPGYQDPVQITFDAKGFPVLDAHARATFMIPELTTRNGEMAQATEALWREIEAGRFNSAPFSPAQLAAIENGEAKIPGYTWHHHQDCNKLLLLPTVIHRAVGHVGGFSLC